MLAQWFWRKWFQKLMFPFFVYHFAILPLEGHGPSFLNPFLKYFAIISTWDRALEFLQKWPSGLAEWIGAMEWNCFVDKMLCHCLWGRAKHDSGSVKCFVMELWKRGYHGYHGYIVLKQSGHFIMVVLQGFYIYLSLWKDRVICSSLLAFSKTLFIHYLIYTCIQHTGLY